MEPTGIEPVTSCLQSGAGDPLPTSQEVPQAAARGSISSSAGPGVRAPAEHAGRAAIHMERLDRHASSTAWRTDP
jgi:hypothetical protein